MRDGISPRKSWSARDVRQIHNQSCPCDELAFNRQCTRSDPAKICIVIKLNATPLRCPSCPFPHEKCIVLNRWFPCHRVQSFAVLETAGYHLEHCRRCCHYSIGHMLFSPPPKHCLVYIGHVSNLYSYTYTQTYIAAATKADPRRLYA